MAKISKRLKELRSSVEANKLYSIDEAVALVKKAATAKFDESIDVSFNLGVDAMRIVGQLGTILGPRGLMPNPKVGTVTPNVAEAVKNAKAGQVQYRTDKAGIVHATIGRASFAEADLKANFDALLDAIVKAKPAAAKGQYLKKIAVSSTMGLGVRVDTASVNN